MNVAIPIVMAIHLFVSSVGFNKIVNGYDKEKAIPGITSFQVVFGVLYTTIAVFTCVWALMGKIVALKILLLQTILFVASGLPMIFGNIVEDLKGKNNDTVGSL